MNERNTIRPSRSLGLALTTLLVGATPAQAVDAIGVTTAVRPELAQLTATSTFQLHGGESLTSYEVLRTGPAGAANLVFIDNTRLEMEKSSSISLGAFVHSGPKTFERATISLARGRFHFTIGMSDPAVYEINTPTATLGVRGGAFTVAVLDDRTVVNVESGDVQLCPIKYKRRVTKSRPENLPAEAKCNDVTAGGSGAVMDGAVDPAAAAAMSAATNSLAISQPATAVTPAPAVLAGPFLTSNN